MATPRSLSSRITRKSSATSLRSRLEVGSSRTSTLTSVEMARAIATSCCTATGWVPRIDAGSMSSPSSWSTAAPLRRIARQSMTPNRLASRPRAMFSATETFGNRSISW